jgi:7,8-dihydropterin-6-yl-methyl-4-(beta-D-ribofuranosyl)aminobenzene 5'-phosphate synthase
VKSSSYAGASSEPSSGGIIAHSSDCRQRQHPQHSALIIWSIFFCNPFRGGHRQSRGIAVECIVHDAELALRAISPHSRLGRSKRLDLDVGDFYKAVAITITTLTENTATLDFLAERGLSILIEMEGSKILLDTGLSSTAVHNAHVLGIDLSTVDKIVLSHGHADHTGGLRDVLRETGKVEIIAHPDIWASKYSLRRGYEHFIGVPFQREELENLGASFNLTQEPLWITENIVTSGEIPMTTDYEQIDSYLFVREGDTLQPDPLADDLALIIKAEQGLVVILGCGHRGIINTLRHARNLTGEERISTVIGGTHLMVASEERLARTTADLREMGIQRLGVSHCTGFHASAWLAREFGDIFFLNNTGNRFSL